MNPLAKIRTLIAIAKASGTSRRDWLVSGSLLGILPFLDLVSVSLIYPVLTYFESGVDGLRNTSGNLGYAMRAIEGVGLPLNLAVILTALGAFMVLRVGIEFAGQVQNARLNRDILNRKRLEIAGAIVRAGIPFHVSINSGELITALFVEVKRYAAIVPSAIVLIASFGIVVVYIAVIIMVSPYILLPAIPLAALIYLIHRLTIRRGSRLGRELSAVNMRAQVMFSEIINGVRLIKLRSNEDEVLGSFDRTLTAMSDNQFETQRVNALMVSSNQPIMLISLLIIVFFARSWLGLSLAQLGILAFAGMRLIPQANQIVSIWITTVNNVAASDNIESFFKRIRAVPNLACGNRVFQKLETGIALDDVSFGYVQGKQRFEALKNVSLAIKRGEMVAVVGKSGAGKSTLADLLVHFHDPSAGAVRVDGVDLRDYDLRSYRRRVALVSQDAIMFDDTIRHNVEFGLDAPLSDARLEEVLRQAHCLDFVAALPKGVETSVGERGARLSGGQRQRLAFARALAIEPEFLVLDEPTSALDSESEAALQATLSHLQGRVTILVIAHRLATIRRSDTIIVMEEGRVAETGNHESLLDARGVYYRLFNLQVNL